MKILILMLCSSQTSQILMSFVIFIGSKLNNVPFQIERLFVGSTNFSNAVLLRFAIITARPGALILGCSGLQLILTSLGALLQHLGAILGEFL